MTVRSDELKIIPTTVTKNYTGIVLLLILATIVLLFNLSYWNVTETSEARYAEISWEMYQSGDFIHPTLLNIGHYHKPPLTYWITALAYKLFGPGVFAARFFLQIALLLQMLLVYKIALALFKKERVALYAAAIYFSFPAVIIASRALTTDAYLATIVLGVIWCWISYQKKGSLWPLYLFYFLLGLGFLDKGPVVFIIPLVFIVSYNKLVTPQNPKKLTHHLFGAVLMLTTGLSWFIILYKENQAFADYFIFKHTVQRFTTNAFGRKQPFWFYLVIIPFTAFPWALLLIRPLANIWKRSYSIVHVLLIWVFIPLLFFSLSTSKLILYVLPLYGGIALLAAYLWAEGQLRHRVWLNAFFLFAILIIASLIFIPIFDLSVHYNLSMYGILLGMASILLITFMLQHKIGGEVALICMSVLFTSGLTVLATFFFHENPEKVHDQRNVVRFVESLGPAGQIYVYNERLPSIAFELQRPVISIAGGDESLNREIQFEKDKSWKQYLISGDEAAEIQVNNSVVIMEDDANLSPSLDRVIKQYEHKKTIDGWLIYY